MEELRHLVEVMAKALVDYPEQVKVTEVEGEQTTVIELLVAKEDLGKIIGKQGNNAQSLRTILRRSLRSSGSARFSRSWSKIASGLKPHSHKVVEFFRRRSLPHMNRGTRLRLSCGCVPM